MLRRVAGGVHHLNANLAVLELLAIAHGLVAVAQTVGARGAQRGRPRALDEL